MAQMETARKMTWDMDTAVHFHVAVPVLWDAIKEPASWAAISNGYIQSISISGEGSGQTRTVHFSDGTERKDAIAQYQPEYRFIVYKIGALLSAGSKDNLMTFTADTEGKGLSRLRIGIKVDGDGKEKKELLEALKKEMRGYIAGLTLLLAQKKE
jgi:hypothetical protein